MSGRYSPTCIVAYDSVLLFLIVSSLLPSSKVITMFPGLRDKGFNYLRAIADANNLSMDRIKVIGKEAPSLTTNDLKHEKVNLVVGEPFYRGSERMLPWQILHFWSERPLLDPLLSEDAFIMPCKGILRLCAMCPCHFWTCGGAVAALEMLTVEGFDHLVVNDTFGACGDLPREQQVACLPCYVWQSGYTKKLSLLSHGLLLFLSLFTLAWQNKGTILIFLAVLVTVVDSFFYKHMYGRRRQEEYIRG